jgi:hypothetical protein
MKIMEIKNCVLCPLSVATHSIFCDSSIAKVKDNERKVGTFEEVIINNIIPDWCPLENVEDFIRAKEILG